MFYRRLFCICFDPDDVNGGGGGGAAPAAAPAAAPSGGTSLEAEAAGTPSRPAAAPAAAAPAGGAPAAAPVDMELPESWRQKFGGAVKLSDVEKYLQTQVGNMRGNHENQLRLIARAMEISRGQQAQPGAAPAAAAPAPETGYYGYPNESVYKAELQANPQRAAARVLAWTIKNQPEVADTLREMINGAVAPALQPLQENMQQQSQRNQQQQMQQFQTHLHGKSQELLKRRPEFSPPASANAQASPHYTAFVNWWQQNGRFECDRAARDPNYDPYEVGARWVLAELGPAQAAAAQQRLQQLGGAAATARPGSAAPMAVKKAQSIEESVAQAAAESRQSGAAVNDDDVKAALNAFRMMGV